MKVLALGSLRQPIMPEQRQEIMPEEVPRTLKLYLDGTIEQSWSRQDKPGVVFLMNVESVDRARAVVEALPLVVAGFAKYDLVPVGPLAPLAFLLEGKPT
jgi:hypothetical protein